MHTRKRGRLLQVVAVTSTAALLDELHASQEELPDFRQIVEWALRPFHGRMRPDQRSYLWDIGATMLAPADEERCLVFTKGPQRVAVERQLLCAEGGVDGSEDHMIVAIVGPDDKPRKPAESAVDRGVWVEVRCTSVAVVAPPCRLARVKAETHICSVCITPCE